MEKCQLFIRFALFVLATSRSLAQADQGMLDFERIYVNKEFEEQDLGPVKWLEDGSGFTSLETSKDMLSARDIVKHYVQSDSTEVIVSAKNLIPKGCPVPLEIDGYLMSADAKRVLIFTNTGRVWRSNTRGDYWLFDVVEKKLMQLGKGLPESSLMFAKISPDGTKAAYVSKNNLYVEDLSSHQWVQLTFDGSRTTINGTFDWAYEEEFSCRDGFRWSPDSRYIAYWQLDASGVKNFYMINNTDSLYSYIVPVQYPKAGEAISSSKVGTLPVDGGKTIWIKLDGDSQKNYLPRMEWAGNSRELLIQYINRHQDTNRVILANAFTGEVKDIYKEKDVAWVDPVDNIQWLHKNKYFTWQGDKTGWDHIYLISRDGKSILPVTSGKFDVIDMLHIDEKEGYVYYIASPGSATQRYLYRSALNGKEPPCRITPLDQPGTHSYDISPDARFAIHRYSSFEMPTTIDVIEIPSHKKLRTLIDNHELVENFQELEKSPVEFFTLTIEGGVSIDGYMMKPYNFDPAKKYPVLFEVYGEPSAQTVLDKWDDSNVWNLLVAQKGYIYISMDTRGTPAPKGRDWRKSCYLKMGTLNSYEQAMAAKEVFKWPFVDTGRVAIWGWSGGGSSTLNAMFRYPEIYEMGMAVAPVADISLYNAIYQERFMRTPQENPEEYRQASPITYAGNLRGKLLLVHGTGDDNVHYQGTERLINELVRQNKFFDLMIYPNRSHSISEGENTYRHIRECLLKYLMSHVEPGGK